MRLPLTIFPKVSSRARRVEFEQLEERAMMAVDLRPIEFTAPNSALLGSGQQVQLEWTVAVEGDTPVTQDFWFDSVYLSSDDQLDPSDRLLTFLTANPPAAPDNTYSLSTTLTLPIDATLGNQFLLLAVDDGDLVPGEANEDNNVFSRPIDIIGPDVDLTVGASLRGGTSVVAGQPFVLDGLISNSGTDTALAPRTQRVYFSTDSFLDPTDPLIAEQTSLAPLAGGGIEVFNLAITLPASTPVGSYTLFVTTDDDNQQFETNDFNNGTAINIDVVTDAPDLGISSLNAPTNWTAGQSLFFDYTVTNNGSADANVVDDRLYLSTDDIWDLSDILLYTGIPGIGPLPPLGSYATSDFFTVPAVTTGSYFLLAVADGGQNVNELDETNNVQSLAIIVDSANLTVTSATGPSTALPGDFVTIDAVITNIGSVGTSAPFWTDSVYLSTDDIFDPSDNLLSSSDQIREGEVSLGPLNPTESYNTSLFFQIPSVAPGNYYFIVVANRGSLQPETTSTDNTFSLPVSVGGIDVGVSNLVVPTTILLGSTIDVSYTVTNNSANPLNDFWADRIYLSDDSTLDPTDLFIDSFDYAANLAAGGSDTLTRSVRFRNGTVGNKFLLVDVRSGIPDSFAGNNIAAAAVETFAPDLAVTSFNGPSAVILNSPFTLSWSVTNQGTVPASADWLDRVYISADQILDGSDIFVSSSFIGQESPLAPGASYSKTLNNQTIFGNLPNGTYYFILSVAQTDQPDINPVNNLAVSGPVSVTRGDLRATSFIAPSTAVLGTTINISYTVDNPTTSATGINWGDIVYLSDDANLSVDDTFIASWFESGPLLAGQSYTRDRNIALTTGTLGNKFLIFRTDSGNSITETDETNNRIAVPINLTAPDIAITLFSSPDTGAVGRPINISYTVTNQGAVPASTPWFDNIQLVDSNQNVVALLTQRFVGSFIPLAAGGSYSQSFSVNIPSNVAPGSYSVRLIANAASAQPETDRSNNTALSPIQISLLSTDLVPTDLSAPSTLTIGQSFDLSWTVQNSGASPTTASWQDAVYLSNDGTLSPDDILLTFDNRPATPPLAGGASYSVQRSVAIPSTTVGAKFLILVTDQNSQIPETDEQNNRRVIPVNVIGADLVAELTDVPVAATFGIPFTLTYTVRNQGNAPTSSDWIDRFFISDAAGTFATLIGASATSATVLAPNGSYTRTVSITVPTNFASGSYRITVVADATFNQQESNEDNNGNSSGLIPFTLPPLPDLVVSASITPVEGIGSQQFLLSWTTTNVGAATAVGPWRSDVTFISPNLGVPAPSFFFTQNLAPGGSITRQEILTFPSVPGNYQLQIVTDGGNQVTEGLNEGNNVYLTSSFAVSPPILPDLVISALAAPPNGTFSGTRAPISFTVTNVGAAPTNASYWSDYAFISSDPNVTFNDGTTVRDDELINNQPYRPIAFPNQAFLQPGESYTTTVDIPIPESYVGTYYLYVFPDGIGFHFPKFQLRESDRQNNLTRSNPFQINLTPPPDLAVTSVVSPLTLFSGQPATINWTVTNAGLGTTQASRWNDEVYLSTDPNLDASDTLLSTALGISSFEHSGVLTSGSAYTNSQSLLLPEGIQGPRYLLVRTDTTGRVFEGGLKTNNTGATITPIQVLLTPPADLVVDTLALPAAATASRPFSVTYSVSNEGASATPSTSSVDRIYLSSDATFSPDDVLLAEVPALASTSLAVGQSYQRTVSVTAPDGTSGSRFVIVFANASSSVFEVDSSNNLLARPIDIESRPADLVVSNLTISPNLVSGQIGTVQWTIQNQGTGDTAVPRWFDKLYVSLDGTPDNLRFVARFTQDGILNAGQSRTTSANFVAPLDLIGPYTFYLLTDAPITRAEDGPAIVVSGPGGSVFEATNESNNRSAGVIANIDAQFADLVPVSFNVGPLQTGVPTTASFVIANQGNGLPNTDTWTDDFYLSTDSTFDGSDFFLGSALHTGLLAAGDTYVSSLRFTLPQTVAAGPYFVLIAVDRPRGPISLFDGLINRVVEKAGEFNNTLAAATTVTQPPTADLAVTQVTPDDITILGRSLGVSWTVSNVGPVRATGDWYDGVYLSIDQVFDPFADRFLGSYQHVGGLDAGDSYSSSAQIDLPAGLSGSYYIFVATDTSNQVFERGTRNNNSNYFNTALAIALGDPVDLVLGNITVPATGQIGRQATIAYSVTNQSALLARGPWDDAIYLSQDDVWDTSDPLFARVRRNDDLAAGASYSSVASADIPLVAPGNYRIILRTDIFNRVPESNKANNIGASLDAATLSATALTLGSPFVDSISSGGFRLYAVNAAAGQTLKFSWDSVFNTNTTEMFVQFGRIATRSDFLFRSATPGESDPSIIVPNSQAGTYYILVRQPVATSVNNPGAMLAEALPFGINAVAPENVGNKGPITLEIDGSLFTRQTSFQLISPIGFVIPADFTMVLNASKAYATFNLSGAQPGSYLLRATTPAGAQSILNPAINVSASLAGGQLSTGVLVPPISLINTLDNFTITYANNGDADIIAPLFLVTSPTSTPFGTDPNLLAPGFDANFLATSPDGPAGILRPGQVVTRTFRFLAPPNVGQEFRFELYFWDANRTDLFDWNDILDRIDPVTKADALFPTIFARLQERVGTTIGDFVRMLARNANLLAPERGDASQIEPLVRLELEEATADVKTSWRGRAVTDDLAIDLSGRGVYARNLDTQETFVTTSRNDGSFVFASITEGTYQILFDGAIADPTPVIISGPGLDSFELSLSRGARISGTVRQPGSLPVAGAQVRLVDDQGTVGSRLTASDGSYTFEGISTGNYTLIIDTLGFARSITPSAFTATTDQALDVNLTPESKLTGTILYSTPPADTSPLRIVLTDAVNGDPNKVFTFETSSSTFQLGGLIAGQYNIRFERAGYVTAFRNNVNLGAASTVSVGSVNLQRAGSIAGLLTSSDPLLLPDITIVSVYQGTDIVTSAVTDSAGNFRVDGLAPGTYQLRVNGATGLQSSSPVVVTEGGIASASINVLPGSIVQGVVTDSLTASPISGVEVVLRRPDGSITSTLSDDFGRYSFSRLPLGTYEVAIYPGTTQSVSVTDADNAIYSADLLATAAASIAGEVRLASGDPVAGAGVILIENGQVIALSVTDELGNYQFLLRRAGNFSVQVTASQAVFSEQSLGTVDVGDTIQADFVAGTASIQVFLFQAGVAPTTGGVRLLRDGGVDAGKELAAFEIDSSGSVLFSNLTPGAYHLVGESGNLGGSVHINVTNAENATTSINLIQQATLAGTVTGPGAVPVAGATIVLYLAGSSTPVATIGTNDDGTYQATNLADGTYDVVVIEEGYAQSVATVAVAGDTIRNFNLSTSLRTLTGVVVDELGNAVAGASVLVKDSAGRAAGQASTNSAGEFTITSATGTGLTLSVQRIGYTAAIVGGISLAAGATVNVGNIAIEGVALGATAFGPAPVALRFASSADFSAQTITRRDVWFNRLKERYDRTLEEFVFLLKFAPPPLPDCSKCGAEKAAADAAFARANEQFSKLNQTGSRMLTKVVEFQTRAAADVAEIYAQILLALGFSELLTVVTADATVLAAAFGTGAESLQIVFKIIKWADTAKSVVSGIKDAIPKVLSMLDAGSKEDAKESAGISLSTISTALKTASFLKFVFKDYKPLFELAGDASTILSKALENGFKKTLALADEVDQIVKEFDRDLEELERRRDDYFEKLAKYNICLADEAATRNEICKCKNDPSSCSPPKPVPSKPPGGGGGGGGGKAGSPKDPNDILGPAGFSDERLIPANIPLDYTIRFENISTATLPAQQVIIKAQLDSDLDFRTFRVGSFGWGSFEFSVPSNQPFLSQRVDLTSTLGFFVDIVANVDTLTGQAEWVLTTIDPSTGLPPTDPRVGFLPPNLENSIGQGFVRYSISADRGLPTGTIIDAEATIFFDTQAPIDTPVWSNRIDAGIPTSSVQPLPATSSTTDFLVSWSASDDPSGSGVAGVTIFVAIDDGPFQIWLSDTTATQAVYQGQLGRRYRFFSVATDNVGNVELPPVTADAQVTVLNPSPFVTIVGSNQVARGYQETFTFTVANAEPWPGQGYVFFVDWNNDGNYDGVTVSPTPTAKASFTFTGAGPQTFRVAYLSPTLQLIAQETKTVQVDRWARRIDPADPSKVDLLIAGTSGADNYRVEQIPALLNPIIRIHVLMENGVPSTEVVDVTGVTSKIRVDLGKGNDRFDGTGIAYDTIIDGGEGNDTILTGSGNDEISADRGSSGDDYIDAGAGNDIIWADSQTKNALYPRSGNDTIFGGEGDDIIYADGAEGAGNDSIDGGSGRDIIIAGGGADVIRAAGGSDLILTGTTTLTHSQILLVQSEWTSSRSLADRVANLRGTGSGPRNNGDAFLIPGVTALDDQAVDTILGGGDGDWLLLDPLEDVANDVDPIVDILTSINL
jgi:subtilase family serine protease